MLGPIVMADEELEVVCDTAHFEPALGHGMALRGDHAHRDTRRLKSLERRLRVAEGANARIVDAVVVQRAIRSAEIHARRRAVAEREQRPMLQ